jgi:hypothetical protein
MAIELAFLCSTSPAPAVGQPRRCGACDEAWDRQQQREFDGAILGMARAGLVADRDPARHLRQQ